MNHTSFQAQMKVTRINFAFLADHLCASETIACIVELASYTAMSERARSRRTAGPDDVGVNVRTGEASCRLARSRRCHVALDCIFKEFRVRLHVQCLHHPVLVKRHRSRLYINDIRHFFH
jgi:hypothetical protein